MPGHACWNTLGSDKVPASRPPHPVADLQCAFLQSAAGTHHHSYHQGPLPLSGNWSCLPPTTGINDLQPHPSNGQWSQCPVPVVPRVILGTTSNSSSTTRTWVRHCHFYFTETKLCLMGSRPDDHILQKGQLNRGPQDMAGGPCQLLHCLTWLTRVVVEGYHLGKVLDQHYTSAGCWPTLS